MKLLVFISFILLTNPLFAQLEKRLDSIMQSSTQPDQPGIALLVEANGKIQYEKEFGLVNTLSKTRISTSTNFRMASVSKQFTAMGILLLEKDHKLSFDDPISRFFPEIVPGVGKR